MKLTKDYYLFFLVVISILFCAFISVVSDVLAVVIVFFKIDRFIFSWYYLLFNAIERAPVPGVILGIGLWLKMKLCERSNRKKLPPSDPE
ncbi:hypothetical protein [Hafnia psychrotolerans]|uniref:Uncharacterized protein n=1 Tax=Hafnia psychrotolerans TaxID=1477018 RepID=A0ABQ1GPN7_9GAMM|nr:hypothetical protein [Hafnia psychrotolerans]GGA47558.1 hypothetical protein GCM10011328_23440 [Hafnia psychrotolerans]